MIITALNSFHGRTLAAITATGQPKYQENFGPLPGGFEYTPYNDIDALKALVKKINGGLNPFRRRSLAAIMLEPLQGEGGITPATKAYMEAARELCDATGALLICDEVQTGMGRTGQMWGHQVLGVEPDVFTTAKALGGGVPIGAMLCKSNADVFAPGDHASTYGGNPLACAMSTISISRPCLRTYSARSMSPASTLLCSPERARGRYASTVAPFVGSPVASSTSVISSRVLFLDIEAGSSENWMSNVPSLLHSRITPSYFLLWTS